MLDAEIKSLEYQIVLQADSLARHDAMFNGDPKPNFSTLRALLEERRAAQAVLMAHYPKVTEALLQWNNLMAAPLKAICAEAHDVH